VNVVVIANPVAGRGRAVAMARAALALIQGHGVEVVLQETAAAGHACELARSAAASGVGRVLAVGGDGTLHEVATALAHTRCAMGVLAAGRGNDFAGALGLPHHPADAAAAMLADVQTPTDLGVINGRVFLTVAATGLDSAVARRVAAGEFRMFGHLAYLAGALWMLPTWRAPRLRLRGDFGEREGPYLVAAAGNTTRYGGGIIMTPGASPHDGLLDCCLVRDLPRLRALALLPRTYSGTHGRYPEVEMVRTQRLEIEADDHVFMTADGELMGESRAVIEVAPGALLIQGRVP